MKVKNRVNRAKRKTAGISFFVITALVLGMLGGAPAEKVRAQESVPEKICVVLDPGHGGNDPGTEKATVVDGVSGKMAEKDCTLKVALYAKEALEADGRFEVYLTREADTYMSLEERAFFARDKEADVLVSLHFNSASAVTANGAEVWQSVLPKYQIPNLPQQILQAIGEKTGLNISRGVKSRESGTGNRWNDAANWDGSKNSNVPADYYGLIRHGARWGVPSMIVEHAFFSNEADLAYLAQADDAGLRALGEADAKALIDFYTGHTHSYGVTETEYPLSCISGGRQAQHCTVCKAKKNVAAIAAQSDASAHFAESFTVTKKATTASEGTERGTCLYCDRLFTRAIAKLPAASGQTGKNVKPAAAKITVAKAVVSKVKRNRKKKTVTITVKKIKGAGGYQYKYGSNKKVTKNKKTVNKKANKLKVKKWKKKTFYVKVRAYKYKTNGKKVYGKWSAAKAG